MLQKDQTGEGESGDEGVPVMGLLFAFLKQKNKQNKKHTTQVVFGLCQVGLLSKSCSLLPPCWLSCRCDVEEMMPFGPDYLLDTQKALNETQGICFT